MPFTAILTTTLTIVASLVIIFFMDEKIRLNLQDFAWVVMLNLAVSLFVTLFLVPALIEKLKIVKSEELRVKSGGRRYMKFVIYFNRFYAAFCRFVWRRKVPVCIVVILLFGLPVFLLPDKLKGESRWDDLYNKTLGFVPFMVGTSKEAFWFPLAAGIIGGLIVSMFGTFCFLPLFMGVGKQKR